MHNYLLRFFMMFILQSSVFLASTTDKALCDRVETPQCVVLNELSDMLRHMLDSNLTKLQNPEDAGLRPVADRLYRSMNSMDYENVLRKHNKNMLPLNSSTKLDMVRLLVARCSSFDEANYEWTFFSQANYLTELSENEVRSRLHDTFKKNDEWLRRVLELLGKS